MLHIILVRKNIYIKVVRRSDVHVCTCSVRRPWPPNASGNGTLGGGRIKGADGGLPCEKTAAIHPSATDGRCIRCGPALFQSVCRGKLVPQQTQLPDAPKGQQMSNLTTLIYIMYCIYFIIIKKCHFFFCKRFF